MTFFDFYDALDAELDALIADNPAEEPLHKGDDSTRKSFAFLIWFMQFYGKRPIYNLNITEGDDDTSCDIIFSTFDNVGKKIFYIVQAKWKSRKNCTEKLDSTAFKATLDDFKLVYSGKKEFSTKNEHFNRQYAGLSQHLIENQYVKFVYLTLCKNNPSVSENVELFKEQCADIEIIDIERLRRDFIERRYKRILPQNPLEYDYNPEDETIILPIEQLEIEKNYLRLDAPFTSYTFFIRPQTIFDLFEKYGFKLFFSNIRNPLITSEYNKQIEQTMIDSPDFFWYFNNNITAITRNLPRRIAPTAQQIEIIGFQIINGAQIAYSVYKAYRDTRNRKKMNQALLQLRLVQSINKAFDLEITRFTNQQNPIEAREFWANDPVQVRLQNESFETSYWYAIRRDEFREMPKNVKIVSNEDFILNYIHYLNHKVPENSTLWIANKKFDSMGIARGQYEKYFDESIKFEDLLVAYRLNETLSSFFNFIQHSKSSFDFQSTENEPHTVHLLSDLRIVLSSIFKENYNKRVFDKLNKKNGFIYNAIAFLIETRKEHFKKYQHLNFPIDMEKSIKDRQPPVTEDEIENMTWEVYFDTDINKF